MKGFRKLNRIGLWLIAAFVLGCNSQPADVTELACYPLDTLDGIISRSAVEADPEITSDGKGSVRITAEKATTVKLFETGDVDVEDARLMYRAKLRSQDVAGKAYLEMWCCFSGKGEFFSRALPSALTGSTEWSSQEAPFLLKKGENPDNIKLNVVIEGTGTVWIDDIRLVKVPL